MWYFGVWKSSALITIEGLIIRIEEFGKKGYLLSDWEGKSYWVVKLPLSISKYSNYALAWKY